MMERAMSVLTPERCSKARRYRNEIDQKTSVIAYLLLLYGLWKDFGICNPRVEEDACGKPYLPEYPNVYFNFSHCPKGCVCGISDQPIGVDIQDFRPVSEQVIRRCCSAEELKWVETEENPQEAFIRIWAMKESYVKMQGIGISQDLSGIDTIKEKNRITAAMIHGCCIAVTCGEA